MVADRPNAISALPRLRPFSRRRSMGAFGHLRKFSLAG
jgi:hypothetical protein